MVEKTKISKINYIKSRISHNCSVFYQKMRNSKEISSIVGMVGDIILLGILLAFSYYAFVTGYWFIKILGFGSLFWIVESRFLPMIANTIRAVRKTE